MKQVQLVVLGLSIMLAAAMPVRSEEAPPSPPKAAEPVKVETAKPDEVPVITKVAEPAGAVTEGQIVIDYNEADIQSVLRTLAAKAKINLMLGEEVIGKVTMHLEGISYEEAMQLVAESKGYGFVKDKNVVKVKSRDALETEPVEVRVVTLNYAKADDVRKTIEPILTKRGKIQVDTRSNTLVISETPSNLLKLAPILATLDAQTPQVLIEAKFVETTRNPKKDIGINWSGTMLNHEVVAGGSALSDNPGEAPKVITDPANNKPLSGFQWVKGAGSSMLSPWSAGVAVLDAGRASAVFSYLSQDTDTELLASPRVVTTDNGKAKISISTQFPIPNMQYSEQKGSFIIAGFDYKDIGIVLNVTPRINKNEFVTLDVTPEASSSTENAKLEGGGTSVLIPIVNTRTATTTVLIKSGNTLAIGGLMRQDTSDTYTKMPLLGDIPGLGVLFRSKSLNKTKRDLLIFLTPTIISPDQIPAGASGTQELSKEPVFTNDKWMPKDNAKPRGQNKK